MEAVSYQATDHVCRNSETTGAARCILHAIAHRADENGMAWPGIETVAKESRCSVRYVQKALKNMPASELRIERGHGRGNVHKYYFPLEKVNRSSPISKTEKVNSETQKVNSETLKGEPRFTRITKNKKNKDVIVKTPKSSPVQEVAEEWNKSGKLPKVLKLTQKRTAAISARLSDPFFRDNWRDALAKIETSPFLTGSGDKGWQADIDWFTRPDSCVKIIEGKYNDRKHSPKNHANTAPHDQRFGFSNR